MSANKTIILVLAVSFAYLALIGYANAAGDCPSSTKVTTCTPKCLQDSECSAIGGKCCPNLCNQRSCVQSNQLGNSGGGNTSPFQKSGSNTSGSYCGNVKCSAFEKCESDRSTKRPKCVRA